MAGRAWMLVPMVLVLLAIGRPSASIKVNSDSNGEKNVTEVSGALVKAVEDEKEEEGRRLGWGSSGGLFAGQCSSRIERALASISSRKSGNRRSTTLDLSGYALRQSLRSAPFDMYVTDMKVKGPGGGGGVASWARVHTCRYDPSARTLQTGLIFTDFAVTGSVKLDDQGGGGSVVNSGKPPPSFHYYHPQHHIHHHYYDDNRRYSHGYPVYSQNLHHNNIYQHVPEGGGSPWDEGWGREGCNMTLRMRRAGLRFTVLPTTPPPDVRILSPGVLPTDLKSIGIATATSFLEPQFISVHAYGCKSPDFIGLRWIEGSKDDRKAEEEELKNRADLMAQEMEQVFLRGVRSLLSQYMEAQLEPALRDTLMLNLGYSVSYGKKKR